jgi:hypothetical protein
MKKASPRWLLMVSVLPILTFDMDFQQDGVGSYQGFNIRGGFFEGKMRSRASTERLEAH